MTAPRTDQPLEIIAGDGFSLVWDDIEDPNGTLDLTAATEVKWVLGDDLIVKTVADGVTVAGPKAATVAVTSADTDDLQDELVEHALKVRNAAGQWTTVTVSAATIRRTVGTPDVD